MRVIFSLSLLANFYDDEELVQEQEQGGSRGSRLRRNGFVLGEDGVGWLVGGGYIDTDDDAERS